MSSLTDIKSLLGTNLPNNILPVRKYNHEQSTNYLKYVLKKNLPKSDNKNLTNDFHWQFLLDRHSFQKKKRLQKKKSFLSRKQRSELNLLKLPKTGWSYSSLQAIRSAWKDYMKENLNLLTAAPDCAEQDWNSFSTIVGKSELVGAEMSVIKSKVPSLVGMKGTVVLESKMTFQIVTESSKLKTIVKDSSVFCFYLDNMKFTVYGKYIATRPSERSVKKNKGPMVPEI
ncbi:unnamed protein product [Phaedon cochleariae]|uniref:Ribonuclease P protein subunit p29 n=1 Tax=Phaedon cochleariae TaxID=80249 RepID=A0A9P0GVI7_PHACE|nr:unnamed protein product [Phaedon cochleariae]